MEIHGGSSPLGLRSARSYSRYCCLVVPLPNRTRPVDNFEYISSRDSGNGALVHGGRVEPDERYFRRRASQELAAARRAVTDAARERRLMLANSFLQRLDPADRNLVAAE